MAEDYGAFLKSKLAMAAPVGLEIDPNGIHPMLFPFQRDLGKWACRKGRCAIFADTGLGKTFMQLEWARLMGERTLILAPLSVARQTVREAEKIGIEVHYTRSGDDLRQVNITNYEMMEHFGADDFGAVVLDESSILKSLDGKTRTKLIEMFADTPYRLCCTATPAPNDITEIANHAEFLGIATRAEMLSQYFVHDTGKSGAQMGAWRLKGHAEKQFYRWMASWGMSVRFPSDLGYDDDGYILPPLTIKPIFAKSDYRPPDKLFFTGLKGISDRANVRKSTVDARIKEVSRLIGSNDSQWLVWCGLNDESTSASAIIDGAIEVKGSDSMDTKLDRIEGFQDGQHRVMVTKPSIAGHGMNFQNCCNMVFLGLSDSWEQYYQAIRRCYRFGQDKPVNVYIVLADIEDGIYRNIQAKEARADEMRRRLIENVQQYERQELEGIMADEWEYSQDEASGEGWKLLLGDSCERMAEVETGSVGLSVFSPPFASLFTYSPTERDLGNNKTREEFFVHFSYIIKELLRVTMSGRLCAVHCADLTATKTSDGYIGAKDFSGEIIKAFVAEDWIYHGRVTIDKNPQAQAIRTKSKGLLFKQLHKDSVWSRPALGDYILIFRKPGENPTPVKPDIDNDTWVTWAHPIWYGISESDTLQYSVARAEKDERHICPLQLETIERCVRLWSNPGEIVCSPFAGIGSEGYVAIKKRRRFIGIELKPEYWQTATGNLKEAERLANEPTLFSGVAADEKD